MGGINIKVSLIINVFNRKEQLFRGLDVTLFKETKPDEIVIIDDGGTDELSSDILKYIKDYPQIDWIYKHLKYPKEKTTSNISCKGKNIGIKIATGDILVFSDPEILQVEETLGILLEALKEDPNCIPIATQIWTTGQRIYQKLTEDNFKRPITIIQHEYAQMTDAEHPQNKKAPDSDWGISGSNNCFAGCFFACRKIDMMALQGFDEQLTGYGWEDWDMFHRLERFGRPLKYINTPIIHLWHDKVYPVNLYEAGNRNGKISEANIKAGILVANKTKGWGEI